MDKIIKTKEIVKKGIYNCQKYTYGETGYNIAVYKTPEDISISIFYGNDTMGQMYPKGNVSQNLIHPYEEPFKNINLAYVNILYYLEIDSFCGYLKTIQEIFTYTDYFFDEIKKLGDVEL